MFDLLDALCDARQATGTPLGLVRPIRLLGLDPKQGDSSDWTEDELAKLSQEQQ